MNEITKKIRLFGMPEETSVGPGSKPSPPGGGINMVAVRAEVERLSGAPLDVRSKLEAWGLTVNRVVTKGDWTYYHFGDCLFNPEHRSKGIISQEKGGAISYGCPHYSCRGKGAYSPSTKKRWADVRRHFGEVT